jgi:asparagine synthase (glutamine-hydrolysing)
VLSGVGGDEMFGGYPSFTRVPAAMRVGRTCGPLLRAVGPAVPYLPVPSWRAAKLQHFASAPSLSSAYRALRGYFMPSELVALAGPALREPAVWASATASLESAERTLFEAAGEETTMAAVARLETRGYLQSQLLRDLDAVSMAHGLEVRTPFVDHELQGILWPALGRHPALLRGKRLLHESLALALPSEVVTAPKRGFTLPFDTWMRGPLREPIRAGLDALADTEWVDRGAADGVWRSWERGTAHWSRPWGLAVLGRFLSQTT